MSSPYLTYPGSGPGPYLPPPGPTPPAGRSGMAVAALVMSIIALLTSLGIGLGLLLTGIAAVAGPLASGEYRLLGTAAGVVEGEPYPGADLEREVTRVLENDWATVDSLSCPTVVVEADVRTVCTGVVDGWDTTLEVTFEDAQGHFVLVEQW